MENIYMFITCPSCKTKFKASDSAVKNGTLVECSVCKYDWVVKNLEDTSDKPSVPREEKIKKSRSIGAIFLGFLFYVAVVSLVIGGVLYMGRDMIAQRYPLSVKLYQKMGISVKTKDNIKIFTLVSKAVLENMPNGKSRLVVRGLVRNTLQKPLKNIKIFVELRNDKNKVILEKPSTITKPIQSGKTQIFTVKIIDPPLNTTDVTIRVER